jgi:hypothetical protein
MILNQSEIERLEAALEAPWYKKLYHGIKTIIRRAWSAVVRAAIRLLKLTAKTALFPAAVVVVAFQRWKAWKTAKDVASVMEAEEDELNASDVIDALAEFAASAARARQNA